MIAFNHPLFKKSHLKLNEHLFLCKEVIDAPHVLEVHP